MLLFITFRIKGIQRRGDGKGCAPLPPMERGGEVGGPRNLFPVCTGDAWNLPLEGTGVVGFRLVSPAEGTSALPLVHFIQMHARQLA